jgi:hypothetical protein
MALQTITKDILTRTSGAALLNLPYDISFLAGYDSDTEGEDVVARKYGELVMARPGTFVGEEGYIDTVCTGAALIVDIMKNGTTIYASTKPQFADGVSDNKITAGVITTTTFVAGDRITFKVNSIGSTVAGKGVRFMLKCKV